jgi:hypothetical protein
MTDLISRLRSQEAVDARPYEIEQLTDEAATALELANTRIAYLTDLNGRIIAAADRKGEADASVIAGLRAEVEGLKAALERAK